MLDLFELVGGTRMHTRYFQAGGLAEDIPRGFFTECKRFTEEFPESIDMYETLLTNQKIWLERTRGLGLLSADDAIALGQSGPVLRASGVDWDLRRDEPTPRTPSSTSTSRSTTRATSTTGTGSASTRCASR